jgi:DNA-binding NarL/FixJ family response regulator
VILSSGNARDQWVAMRILIADDSPIVRDRLSNLLGDVDGAEVIAQAKDATQAKALAKNLKPDIAILDLRMPQGNGVEVLREIKRGNPDSRVIMLTNFVDAESRRLCLDQGADYFFDKSIEFEKVLEVLRGLQLDTT